MEKMYVWEYDFTGTIINEFEIVPSEKSKIGKSRIYVESGKDRLFGFKVYVVKEIEILDTKLL